MDLVARVKVLTKAYKKSANKWLSSFASVLRIRTALKLIQAEYGGVSDFPNARMIDDFF
ncbi:hypothetical protein KXD40_002628 [Peronospora effusa]|nr:hypothetical protein KXD40_002628 [Peronospora effusa]